MLEETVTQRFRSLTYSDCSRIAQTPTRSSIFAEPPRATKTLTTTFSVLCQTICPAAPTSHSTPSEFPSLFHRFYQNTPPTHSCLSPPLLTGSSQSIGDYRL